MAELPSDKNPVETVDVSGPTETSAIVGGAYDGASRTERMLALWAPPIQSADADLIPEKGSIDGRVRDSLRNDAYVRGGGVIHKDSIVGSLYALNSKPATKALGKGFDNKWEEEFQEEVETLFTLAAESPDNWFDASRHNSLTEMVRLAVGMNAAGGEVLASVEWLRENYRPFKTAIQFIDADRLCNPSNLVYSSEVRGGVRKNKRGEAIGYYVRRQHPRDLILDHLAEPIYVPARKPWGRLQMVHIFEQQRPDQSRGVSEMVSALKEIRITRKFRDVVLQNAVVNATYAASIESDLPSNEVFAAMGAGDPGKAMEQATSAYLSQIAAYAGNAKNLAIDGVKIPHLFPGTKLNLHKAGEGGPLGTEFEQSLLRYIAAALGVSYEQLARDYSKTNYSSARAAMAETWKHMTATKRMVADKFATIVYRLWLEEMVNNRKISSMPAEALQPGWLYEPLRMDALSRCEWIGASRGQIDELKETQAAVLRLKYNLSTEEMEMARLGQDWRAVKKQRAREIAMDEELGLTRPEDDNMMNATTGDPREKGEE